jgi:hypothetical protein
MGGAAYLNAENSIGADCHIHALPEARGDLKKRCYFLRIDAVILAHSLPTPTHFSWV